MSPLYHPDTIAAIATASGQGSVAIVRVSGPDTLAIADRVFECRLPTLSARPGGVFVHGYVRHQDQRVDECLCLIFRNPRSYTGEDVVEFHGHGGSVCARRVLRAVLDAGARSAEAGEFTKRAFLNGRMDLLQAEAVQDLVQAHSERASTAALAQLEGSLSKKFNLIYDPLLQAAAQLEATLDFPEDELPEAVMPEILQRITDLSGQARALIATWEEGHLLRDGALVVISGKPNVGKSTLLNLLLGKERAIVSATPGTTRDTIEEDLVLNGIPLRLVDTAGLRNTGCDIERQGIHRTRTVREKGDLHLYLVDASQPMDEESLEHVQELNPARCVVVLNKTDKGIAEQPGLLDRYSLVKTSLVNHEGLHELKSRMAALLGSNIDLSARPHAVISERHRRILVQSVDEMQIAIDLLKSGQPEHVVIAASQLRLALELIGQATGREYEEALLDQIFASFCIGK